MPPGVGSPVRAAFLPAVGAPVRHLDREEQQVPPDRWIALPAGTRIRQPEDGIARGGDVPDLEAVDVPLEDEVPPEGQVGVHVTGRVFEGGGLLGGRHQLEPAQPIPASRDRASCEMLYLI